MSDGMKKRRGASPTVHRAVEDVCSEPLPCLANIFVYAGLDPACTTCQKYIDEMRQLEGWERHGAFWRSSHITPAQQQMIKDRIREEYGTPT